MNPLSIESPNPVPDEEQVPVFDADGDFIPFDFSKVPAHLKDVTPRQTVEAFKKAFAAFGVTPSEQTTAMQDLIACFEIVCEQNSIYEAALDFYANPDTYFAIAFRADRPAGDFADDLSDVEKINDHYDRPMPGKTARLALGIQTKATLFKEDEPS